MTTTHPLRGSTMQFGRVGSIYVCVHPSTPPSSGEWDTWLEDVEREVPTLSGALVYTEGGGPDARQRKETAAMWNRQARSLPIAVVTKSPVVRGMLTALNFFLSRPLRGYAPEQLDEALTEYLKVAPEQQAELRRVVAAALANLHVAARASL